MRKLLHQQWAILVFALCLCARSPGAESSRNRLAVDRVKTPPGAEDITVTVTGVASARVVGYQFAIGHHIDTAVLIEVQVSDAVADHGAEFVLTRMFNEADTPYGTILVVLDYNDPFGDVLPLDLSEEIELARFVYQINPELAPGETTTLELRHRTFGVPPVPAIFVDESLNSIQPETQDGEIRVLPMFLRGDCNHDGLLDVSDPISLLLHLFGGGATPPCIDGCDADDDGELNLTDALVALNFLFGGGAAPGAPYPQVGVDPSIDRLSCLEVTDSTDSGDTDSGEMN